jgi:DNA-binding transcriptional LysR family regulator
MIVTPANPLSGRKRVSLESVAGEPVALLSANHGIRQLLARVEADQGFHLVPHIEATSIDVVRRSAIANRGITFLPQFAATAEIADNRLVAVPLTDDLLIAASAHLVVRSQRRLPTAVEQLVTHLATRMHAFSAPKGNNADRASNTW